MIKAVLRAPNGKPPLLLLGLSFDNLRRFLDEPGDTFIKIEGAETGLPVDVVIFSGETEADMETMMAGNIGPDTKVHVEPRR